MTWSRLAVAVAVAAAGCGSVGLWAAAGGEQRRKKFAIFTGGHNFDETIILWRVCGIFEVAIHVLH